MISYLPGRGEPTITMVVFPGQDLSRDWRRVRQGAGTSLGLDESGVSRNKGSEERDTQSWNTDWTNQCIKPSLPPSHPQDKTERTGVKFYLSANFSSLRLFKHWASMPPRLKEARVLTLSLTSSSERLKLCNWKSCLLYTSDAADD